MDSKTAQRTDVSFLARISAPAFWAIAICAAMVSAIIFFFVVGLAADALGMPPPMFTLLAFAAALIAFFAVVLNMRSRRKRKRLVSPAESTGLPKVENQTNLPARERRRRLDRLVDLNFKTTDGVTRFFKYGALSRGIIVDSAQETELRRIFRRNYLWCGGLGVGNILVGPVIPLLLLPALLVGFSLNVNDIVAAPAPPDKISFAEHVRRMAALFPIWLIRLQLILSAVFVAIGCWAFIHEATIMRRLAAQGVDYDSNIVLPCVVIVFFSFGIATMSALLSVRRRNLSAA